MDLRRSFNALNLCYFDGALQGVKVKWDGRLKIAGQCWPDAKVIEMNPALREKWVPHYYAARWLYHEMLHLVIPTIPWARDPHHPPSFVKAEARYLHHASADEWERRNLWRFQGRLRWGTFLT